MRPSLRRVINASGVIVHTNLGRAPLARSAIDAVDAVASGYSNLEYDLEEGRRGARNAHAEALLRDFTGAEAATVVNNCASAVLLAAAAQLLTAMPASAPVSSHSSASTWSWREPR